MLRSKRAKRRIGRKLFFCILIIGPLASLILISLFNFVEKIPDRSIKTSIMADAIVVLTGGSGRLEKGLSLLRNGKGKKLLVSGVYQGVDVRNLMNLSRGDSENLLCCIELGYSASSTHGNALETKRWVEKEKYTSVRLVTANYHMPRSIMEFNNLMPELQVVPTPVFPKQFKLKNWWLWPGSATLILTEYAKFTLSYTGHQFSKLNIF